MTPNNGGAREKPGPKPLRWRKSSHSNNGGECVEVATYLPGVIAIRDSKDPSGSLLMFTSAEWREFLRTIRPE